MQQSLLCEHKSARESPRAWMGCSIPQSGYNGGNLPLGQAFRAQLFRLAKTQRGRHPSFLHKLSQAILLTLTPSKHQLLTIMQCISPGFNAFADGSAIFSFAASWHQDQHPTPHPSHPGNTSTMQPSATGVRLKVRCRPR